MPKKFTKVIDRGRITPHKYNFKNNNDGTSVITDIPSNVNVEGTKLNKDLFNPLQQGLIFTVDTTHNNNNGVDVYELDLIGLKGSQDVNGLELFDGLSINIKIAVENQSKNIMIKISGDEYRLLNESKENLQVGQLKADKYYQITYSNGLFALTFGSVNDATEETKGIAKIYKKTDTENDAKKIKEYTRKNKGNDKEIPLGLSEQDYERESQNAKTYWENLIEKADHTKFVTMKDLAIILKEILQPANENEYGLVSHNTIKTVSPKPDLSPYIPFNKGYRNTNNSDFVLRGNSTDCWAPRHLYMYLENGDYMGCFHVNGGRAYYKVPNRNGGNWCEIMDNHDMAARDSNIQHAHNRITETWNKAFDAWNKANDAQVNRIYEIRMVGYVEDGINGKGERNGYVLTKVSRNYGETQDHIKIGSRALQFHRNGQWLNAYFA